MKTKKNINENINILETKWTPAPGGRDFIDKCQERIYVIHLEIAAQGAFFRNLSNCDFSHEELYGLSLMFIRISKRLKKIHDQLGHIAVDSERQD